MATPLLDHAEANPSLEEVAAVAALLAERSS